MRKHRNNKFDLLVEKLMEEFSKIPNFDLTRTDSLTNLIFNKITFRIADISSYKELVCSHFIPATNKAIFESKKDIQNSKYKQYLKISEQDYKETLYETIRLSYVGLFHKLENYLNEVINITESIYGEIFDTEGTIEKWAKDNFDFKIKNWRQFLITHKINWISNCVKHKDGLPIKEPIPRIFENIDKSKRIELSKDEFKKDCELLIEFYPFYLNLMNFFAQHKLLHEKPLKEEDYIHSPGLYEKQVKTIETFDTKFNQFIDIIKQLE